MTLEFESVDAGPKTPSKPICHECRMLMPNKTSFHRLPHARQEGFIAKVYTRHGTGALLQYYFSESSVGAQAVLK